MNIIGYYLIIKEQRSFYGSFKKAFEGNLLSEEIVLETIREYVRNGNPLEIECGANIVADKEK